MCLNITISKCLVANQTNMSNFHALEVVGRETQLQGGELFNLASLIANMSYASYNCRIL